MQYRYATDAPDRSDLASGRVLHGLPGHPAFPVRLMDEVFQRCLALRARAGAHGPCAVHDPCCGGAYHLAVLGLLHRESIREIAASDVDPDALGVARRNLALLEALGMDARIAELAAKVEAFGKDSHREALESARRLRARVAAAHGRAALRTRLFQADALDAAALRAGLDGARPDIVFADVPYGRQTGWQAPAQAADPAPPLRRLLDALLGILSPESVVALAFDKGQKAEHERYRRLERFQVGHRRVVILAPAARPR